MRVVRIKRALNEKEAETEAKLSALYRVATLVTQEARASCTAIHRAAQ